MHVEILASVGESKTDLKYDNVVYKICKFINKVKFSEFDILWDHPLIVQGFC